MNVIIQCTKVKSMRRIKLCQRMESVHREDLEVRQGTIAHFFFLLFPFLTMHFCVGPFRARETNYS